MSEEIKDNISGVQTQSETAKLRGMTTKDLLIPISIVIAGLFVGAGLYFGGGSSPQGAAQQIIPSAQPEAPADTTDKISAVDEDDHIKGSIDAKVKIVEFSDFDCPFCSKFHDVMNAIVEKYPSDEVAWVYRQFPLEQLHPNAPAVALASECVAHIGGNEAFWNFSDAYFAARGSGDGTAHGELIPRLVAETGVDQSSFTECFESGEFIDDVQADMNNAVETGGRGTPWSVIIGPTGKTYPVNGALPQASVEQLIEAALQEA